MDKKNKIALAISIVLLVIITFILINFQACKDFIISRTFQPSEKMLAVENSLNLTEKGRDIFRATSPALESREVFNKNCNSGSTEASILGCYVSGNIHVFNVESKKISGIVESTSAHELLHAVWARMSEKEKTDLTPALKSISKNASSEFKKSIELYDESMKLEETYVRAATQIKNLPEVLETHFATIFKDQDAIVGFYDSYIFPFSELEKNLDKLSKEISDLKEIIDQKTTTYSAREEVFAKKVSDFNSCANTPNCFTNANFNSRRAELLAEQSELNNLYESLNADITTCNQKIDEYNDNVIYGKNLQNIINSNSKPEEQL